MDSIEKALLFSKRYMDIRWKNMFFEKNFQVYKPVSDGVCDMWGMSNQVSYFANLEKSLPLLRKSILDESLPLQICGLPGLSAGGRIPDAMILGMFEYSKSLPELLEVASHDLNYEMRGISAESIGDMKKEAWNLVPSLCKILRDDKNFHVKKEISKALGKIGNSFALNSLRDSFDEARSLIRNCELRGYPFKFETKDPFLKKEADSACYNLENCIVSIFRLDKKQGREILAKGLNDWSHTVYHWTKRAGFWFDYYSKKD